MQEEILGIPNNLGDRLRKWRKSVPLKSYQLAKLISISQGSLSDIENNKSQPSAETISKIHLHTDINIVWLLIGQGSMRKRDPISETMDSPYANEEIEEYGKDPNLKELIEKLVRIYNQGDAGKKAHLLGFLIGADPGV